MDVYQVINKDVFEIRAACSCCSKQLNVSPIVCVEIEDQDQTVEIVCGRCISTLNYRCEGRKMWRQNLYEIMGKFLTFPCSYKNFGCKEVLYWDDVLTHEKECMFKGVKCPLAHREIFPEQTCVWEGNNKNLQEHIDKWHQYLMFNPPQIELKFSRNYLLFTKVDIRTFTIVFIHKGEDKYNCLVIVNGSDLESQCYRYQLELFGEENSNSIVLRKPRLQPLSSMIDDINNAEKMLEIDLVQIKHMLHTRSVSAHFSIVKKPTEEIILIKSGKEPGSLNVHLPKQMPSGVKLDIDEKILQELECPVCSEYMIAPIYICERGHSICSICMKRITRCPNCRDNYVGARNYTLEKLATTVNYPCSYRNKGCRFVTISSAIRDHELTCELSGSKCLFDCGWRGPRPGMNTHLRMSHSDWMCKPYTMTICDTTAGTEICYFLEAHDEIFRFSIEQDRKMHVRRFNVQQVGYFENSREFQYQLHFLDSMPFGMKLVITNICQSITDLKTAHSTGACLPDNILDPFIFSSRFFCFRIVISKVQSLRRSMREF